jgi:hypothetical protein
VIEALLDGILMRAGECRVDKISAVRAALMYWKLIAILDSSLDFINVAEVNHWVNSLAEQVQTKGNKVNVSGSLSIAKKAPLDTIGASHVTKLGRSNRSSTVIMRV